MVLFRVNCNNGLIAGSNGAPVKIQDVALSFRVVGFQVEAMLERFLKQYIS